MHTYLCLATIFAHVASIAFSAPSLLAPALTDGTILGSIVGDSKLLPAGGPVEAISATEIDSYAPYMWFTQASWCSPTSLANWRCSSCQTDSIKDFQLYASGGDGSSVQYWYVGWWPSKQEIIVGHQGTDFNETAAILTDAKLLQAPLNPKLFPGIPSKATTHIGFQTVHAHTATLVLEAVKKIVDEKGATRVVTVGHSLGGALALLEALYLKLQLPNVNVATRTIGQPRVGNDIFATFVDEKVTDLVRITNKRDVVPVLTLIALGYRHTRGEKHINEYDAWNACSGRDNLNPNCSMGHILRQGISWQEHFGPYPGGITLGAGSCV